MRSNIKLLTIQFVRYNIHQILRFLLFLLLFSIYSGSLPNCLAQKNPTTSKNNKKPNEQRPKVSPTTHASVEIKHSPQDVLNTEKKGNDTTLQNKETSPSWLGPAIAAVATVFTAIIALLAGQQIEKGKHKYKIAEMEKQLDIDVRKMRTQKEIEQESRNEEIKKTLDKEIQETLTKEEKFERTFLRYLDAIVSELNSVKILDMLNPRRLEAVYIQTKLRLAEPLKYVNRPEDIVATFTSSNHDIASIESQNQDSARSVALDEALLVSLRVVILGDPGAGKTTMLRHLCLKVAEGRSNSLPRFPVYVELHRFIGSGIQDLLSYLVKDLHNRYGFSETHSELGEALHSGTVALLLDGLDEVLIGNSSEEAHIAQSRVIAEVHRLSTLYPLVPIAITCRKAGWRGGLNGFSVYEVTPFTNSEISTFVTKWFSETPNKASQLNIELRRNKPIGSLAATPLLLVLITLVFEQDLELPERRAELYRRCVSVLLQEWDAHRGIKRHSQFTTDRKRDLLIEIAWHFHVKGLRYFQKDELLEVIANFLPTIALCSEDATTILDEISVQYGLLREQAHGWFGFLHLTLQEYLCALATVQYGDTGLEVALSNARMPWWNEVILLMAGVLTDASPLLFGLAGRSDRSFNSYQINDILEPNEPFVLRDDLFNTHLILIANCLVGTPRLRVTGLRDRIIQDVFKVLQKSSFHLDWDRAATTLVALKNTEINRDLLHMVTHYIEANRERVSSVLNALATSGSEEVAQKLISFVQSGGITSQPLLGEYITAACTAYPPLGVPFILNALNDTSQRDKLSEASAVRQVIELGTPFESAKLLTYLETGKLRTLSSLTILNHLVENGDRTAIRKIWQLFQNFDNDLGWHSSIVRDLNQYAPAEIADEAIEMLSDEGIAWEMRWLITRLLDSWSKPFSSKIRDTMFKDNIDIKVRIGIAATLASLGNMEGRHLLKSAVKDSLIPDQLKLGYHIEVGGVWRRIIHSLVVIHEPELDILLRGTIDWAKQMRHTDQGSRNSLGSPMEKVADLIQISNSGNLLDHFLDILRSEAALGGDMTDLIDASANLLPDTSLVQLVSILNNDRLKALIESGPFKLFKLIHYVGFSENRADAIPILLEWKKTAESICLQLSSPDQLDRERPEYIRLLGNRHGANILTANIYEALFKISVRSNRFITCDGRVEEVNNLPPPN